MFSVGKSNFTFTRVSLLSFDNRVILNVVDQMGRGRGIPLARTLCALLTVTITRKYSYYVGYIFCHIKGLVDRGLTVTVTLSWGVSPRTEK